MSTWDWSKFEGGAEALKWNRKELSSIDEVMRYVNGCAVVVQAGGNLGIFPKRLAELFHVVYTFEPDQELFVKMTKNAPEANIIRFQAALGSKRELIGTSRVRRDGKTNIHEGITHVSGPGVVPTLLIDDLNLPACDLVYLDLEGYEPYALMGAEQTLRRCRPVLAVEINKSAGFMGFTKDSVRRMITSMGYEFKIKIRSDEVFVPVEQE